jgi:transposase
MIVYCMDLRPKILHTCEHRLGSQCALADLFGVSLSSVEKLLGRRRTTGDIAPSPHAGGQRPYLGAAADPRMRRLVHDNADLT